MLPHKVVVFVVHISLFLAGLVMGRRRWADQVGPSFAHVVGHGPAWFIAFHRMGGGPARPIKFSEDGPRPGPVRLIFRGWAAARAGPIEFQIFLAYNFFNFFGPARPMTFSISAARFGPPHDIHSEAHETRAPQGSAHHLCGPVHGFERPAHVLSRTKRCTLTFLIPGIGY